MNSKDVAPFKKGDRVIYKPSGKGLSADVMSSPSQKLVPLAEYVVRCIENSSYLVVEGYHHPGGGLHWTEFERVPSEGCDVK